MENNNYTQDFLQELRQYVGSQFLYNYHQAESLKAKYSDSHFMWKDEVKKSKYYDALYYIVAHFYNENEERKDAINE